MASCCGTFSWWFGWGKIDQVAGLITDTGARETVMIELYHFWSSVCSVKVRMCLEEKGVQWQSRYVDLFRFDQLRPEYLAINPDGVVPTLVHDGHPVHE